MPKFQKIRNVSNFTYWSQVVTTPAEAGSDFKIDALRKYGTIYVNRNGGYMTPDCVKEILETRWQDTFPKE